MITLSVMAAKPLASQFKEAKKAIEEFDAPIAQAMNQHPDAHMFTFLRSAGYVLAHACSARLALSVTTGMMPTTWRRSAGSHL